MAKKENIVQDWLWGVMSIIIVALFLFSILHLQREGEDVTPSNPIAYNYAQLEPEQFLENQEKISAIDFSKMSEKEVNVLLPELENDYHNAVLNENFQMAQLAGLQLAMAYIKIHDIAEATKLLNEMIHAYPYDTIFVKQCKKLLARIG